MTVADLIPGVTRKLGNRTDIANDCPLWIRDAVLELTMSYSFSDLQTTGPVVNFVIGQSEYAATFFTNNNEKASRITSWYRYNQGTATTTNNTTLQGTWIKFRTLPVVEQMAKVLAPPTKWSRINKNTLLVGAVPDQAYATFQRYQKQHPFPKDTIENNNFLASLLQQEIYMPDDWKIIVEFWAARVGALEKRMLDYAQSYYQVLYGDPEFQKSGGTKGAPGLIFERQSQFERDSAQNERAFQPVVMQSSAH